MGAIDPAEQRVLDMYLDLGLGSDGKRAVRSCYSAAVADARAASGRDTDGRLIPGREDEAGRWLGGVAWLCLFDQIGQTIRLRRNGPTNVKLAGKRFDRALTDFAPALGGSQRSVLWKLRNSLAHSYSLLARDRDLNVTHRFALDNDPIADLIRTDGNRTVVNLRALGDLGNRVVYSIERARTSGALALNPTPNEMLVEWFVAWPVDTFRSLNSSSVEVTGNYVPTAGTGASATAELE